MAWTTVENEADAQRLARGAVENRLAACAQVDAPVTSVFRWQGKLCEETEYRLWLKFPVEQGGALATWIRQEHPYEVAQWNVLRVDESGDDYVQWARDCCRVDGERS